MEPCHESSAQVSLTGIPVQNVYYLLSGEFYVGELIAKEDVHEQYCLLDSGLGTEPTLELCLEAAKRGQHIYWDFQQMEGTTGRMVLRGSVGSRVEKVKGGQVAEGYAMQDAAMIPS
ncbi:hypothetical protein LEMLEM_LOCUS12984 [Lemmus lemmus]